MATKLSYSTRAPNACTVKRRKRQLSEASLIVACKAAQVREATAVGDRRYRCAALSSGIGQLRAGQFQPHRLQIRHGSGGPVGLTFAMDLAQRGVGVTLAEMRAA